MIDPAMCDAEFRVIGYEIHLKANHPDFVTYTVEIFYDVATWSIQRRFNQFKIMNNGFKSIPGYTDCLPEEDNKMKFAPAYLNKRQVDLDDFMQIICASRIAIFNNTTATSVFTRFIAPVQLGDKKGPNFVLPFKLEL